MGEPVANLIPSKVPLGETFNELIDAGKRYSKTHVVRHQQALGRKVSLWELDGLLFFLSDCSLLLVCRVLKSATRLKGKLGCEF